jgi:arylsulfatase A-like enzyme
MKCRWPWILALFALSPPLCPGAEQFQIEPGFTRLDNGKDLTGWFGSTWSGVNTGNVDGWSVVDGAIHLNAATAKNHLFSHKTYGRSVIIRLQFNAAKAADSGLNVHGKQFQVRDYIYSLPDTRKYAPPCKPPGQWNDLEFDVTDGVAVVRLNGRVIEKAWKTGDNPDIGLGLQREKGDFAFRYVRLKEKKPGENAQPNVVLIIADDLGYGEVSCYPQQQTVHTPNIDRLAQRGIRMTDGYSADPMCLASRAALLTGNYFQRFRSMRKFSEDERLFGHYLKPAGYVSGCVGKWHNCVPGTDLENGPLERGFDEFFGFLGGMRDYFDPQKGFQTGKGWIYMPVYNGTQPVKEMKYLTDELTDRAVDFITRHKERPLFLYLAYNAKHTPRQAPERYMKRNQGDLNAAMIDAMDEGVGRVLDTLASLDVDENTLVFFIGDNGGSPGPNWKLRGRKGQWFEGGIRVPFLVSWPKALPRGQVYSQPVMHIDVLPTVLAAAGVEVPAGRNVDGRNLLPYWQGKRQRPPHEVLFWGRGGRFAVRRGDWKLVRDSDVRKGEPETALYNLKEDPQEKLNLLEKEKQIAGELTALRKDWLQRVAPKPAR